MTATSDLGPWLRQQRENKSWSRNEMAQRLIRTALITGDTAIPVAASIYRWERGTVTPPTGTASTTATPSASGLSA